MHSAYLSLGSNEGDRLLNLQQAMSHLGASGTIAISSPIYETAAWGIEDQADFFNCTLLLETSLTPIKLLENVQQIENAMGRIREIKWGPRIIDIDILFYDLIILHSEKLMIPHPFLQDRRFVLKPLCDIAPQFVHPQFSRSVEKLLEECTDKLDIKRI